MATAASSRSRPPCRPIERSSSNRRLRGLAELISSLQQQLARWLDTGGARLADGSQLAVANYPGCQQRSHFAGQARYGYARSQHRFIWGVRLVLLTDLRGLPLGYTVVPANEKEYEPPPTCSPAPQPRS